MFEAGTLACRVVDTFETSGSAAKRAQHETLIFALAQSVTTCSIHLGLESIMVMCCVCLVIAANWSG